MQVYECVIENADMTRDMDLIRQLLLWIESNPKLDGKRWLTVYTPDDMGVDNHSLEEIDYHLRLLIKAGLVEGRENLSGGLAVITALTWQGHEFIDNVKDVSIWEQTKERLQGLSGVALSVVAAIAEAEIKKKLHLP
jgi:hypothetical protein